MFTLSNKHYWGASYFRCVPLKLSTSLFIKHIHLLKNQDHWASRGPSLRNPRPPHFNIINNNKKVCFKINLRKVYSFCQVGRYWTSTAHHRVPCSQEQGKIPFGAERFHSIQFKSYPSSISYYEAFLLKS